MPLTIRASLSGTPISAQSDAARDTLAKAVTAAVTAAGVGAKLDLRAQLKAASPRFGRLSGAIRGETYPKPPKFSMGAATTIYAHGRSAERMFEAFSSGAEISVRNRRALAIPLHNYRGIDGKLLGPKSSFFAGRLFFVPSRERGGQEIGMLATKAPTRASARRKLLRTKGRQRAAEKLGEDLIPQFLLVKRVKLPRVLTPEAIIGKWADQVPALTEQALARLGEG